MRPKRRSTEPPNDRIRATASSPTARTKEGHLFRRSKLAGSGDMLLEFTNLGGTYTVIYADNPQFNHARISPPAVKSGANRIQWLDYGPPATTSFPSGTRYYRVILNP